jgi:hypothetical protein
VISNKHGAVAVNALTISASLTELSVWVIVLEAYKAIRLCGNHHEKILYNNLTVVG